MAQPDGPKGVIQVALRGEGAVWYSLEDAVAQQAQATLGAGHPLKYVPCAVCVFACAYLIRELLLRSSNSTIDDGYGMNECNMHR